MNQSGLSLVSLGLTLGNRVMQELRLAAYVVAMTVRGNQHVKDYIAGWLNEPHAVASGLVDCSRSPMMAHWKASELLACHSIVTDDRAIRCTPIFTDPKMRGTGLRGGVQVGENIYGVSALASRHDQFLGAMMHAACLSDLGAEFYQVKYTDSGSPLVLLRARDPHQTLKLVATICQVDVFDWDVLDGAKEALSVAKDENDERGPASIMLAAVNSR